MLEFRGASKQYGAIAALDDCSFSARSGRLTGFLGPNGAGKTTAMRTVFGLVELDAGAVSWRGQPITPGTRCRFGYMPEERGLYPRMRVREQLVYFGQLGSHPSTAVEASVDTWLERLGLAARAADRLDSLSHGNQQRVQLITALLNQPELLVLDEPFSGLDPLAITDMSELLVEVADAGVAVLFSSHQLDLVEDLCQDVVIIDNGRIALAGELEQLRGDVPQRFVDVHYRGAQPEWREIEGAQVVESGVGHARLRLEHAIDVTGIAATVERTAAIESLAYQPPTLSELFHQAVAA